MIRAVTPADAAAISTIYSHYVLHTTISFEEEPVDANAMAQRIGASKLPWLVYEEHGEVLGYAYASPWRVRPAYRYAVESSVYLAPGATGRRLGQQLYRRLFEALRQLGLHTVIGGIALPNPASVALHESMGFHPVAHFEEVGWKQQRWVDVGYWQLKL